MDEQYRKYHAGRYEGLSNEEPKKEKPKSFWEQTQQDIKDTIKGLAEPLLQRSHKRTKDEELKYK